MTLARRDRLLAHVVTALAIALAVPLGIAAASGARSWLFAAIGGVVVVIGVAHWFRRDPVMVLVALWAFQIVRTPLAAATASVPGAGTLIDQLTDACLLVILLSLAWEALGRDAPRRDLRYFWPAVGLAACGLAGSVVQGAPLNPTFMGLWLGTKFWLMVGVTAAVPWRPGDLDRVLRVLVAGGAVVGALALVDAATAGGVADAVNSNVKRTALLTDYRSGAAQSLYAHPNELSLAMSLLVAIWLAHLATSGRPRLRDGALLVLFVAAALASLRLKAVLSVSAVFAVVAAVQVLGRRRHMLKILTAGALVVALILALMSGVIVRQLKTYGGSGPTARAQLYTVGTQIAEQHFPFGVGFGRFASAPSRETYSTVYDDYGLSRIWGLSRAFPRFISDTSWPAVVGETGFAGLLCFVAGLLALLGTGIATLRGARGREAFAPLALIAVLAVVVVDSTGNATLFSWDTATAVALVSGATLAQRRAAATARSVRAPDPWILVASRERRPQPLARVPGG